jgi:hypothetical protein
MQLSLWSRDVGQGSILGAYVLVKVKSEGKSSPSSAGYELFAVLLRLTIQCQSPLWFRKQLDIDPKLVFILHKKLM